MAKQKTLPHFPFYPADFLSKTGRLTDEQVGAYIRLLCEQWIAGDIPLVDANGDASALRMLSESIDRSWPYISKYFERDGNGMKNQRMEEVRLKAIDIYSKRVNAANARWSDDDANDNASGNASACATQNSKLITHNAEPISQSVLGAHTAFINISSKKPTNHELLQITNLCHQYTAIVVIEAITVMGDHGWHSIGTLKKVLTGELPKVNEEGDGVDKRYLV